MFARTPFSVTTASSPRCSAERSFHKRAERTPFTAGGEPRARTRAKPGCRPHEQAPVHTTHTHTNKRTRISFTSTPPFSRPTRPRLFPSHFSPSDHTGMCHRNRTRQPQHFSPRPTLLPAIHCWLHGTPSTEDTASARRPGILRWNVGSTGS